MKKWSISPYNPFKWKHQIRRAAALITALDTLVADAETRARFAESLELADWQDKVAVIADQISDRIGDPNPRFEDSPPSAETVAIAISTLQAIANTSTKKAA